MAGTHANDDAGAAVAVSLALRPYLRPFELRGILAGIYSMARTGFTYYRLVRLAGSRPGTPTGLRQLGGAVEKLHCALA